MDKAVDRITTSCHHCVSLRTVATTLVKQSNNPPPETVGISFAADVINRAKQFILVLRECVTSYTISTLLPNERHDTLRDGLISLCINTRPLDFPLAVIRTDPTPCFMALDNDSVLHDRRIVLEIGRIPMVGQSPLLSVATATLNSRIRSRGLPAREIWTQRDQFSNIQIPLSDYDLISQQQSLRKAIYPSSEKSKAHLAQVARSPSVAIGNLVYLYCVRNKSRGRGRYLVTSIDGAWCQVRKFFGSLLRSTTYLIKRAECYKVPMDASPSLPHHTGSARFDTDDEDDTSMPPASPPQIPQLLYTHTSTAPAHRWWVKSTHPATGACCSLYSSSSSRYRY